MARANQQEEAKVPVPQKGRELAVVDFGEDAGMGMEDVSQDEYRIPFLRVLDPKSPQCRPVQAGGMGAKGGDILNTATGEIWDGTKGFIFLPVFRDHNFIEWIPKNDDGSGGGFVGIHAPDEQIVGQLRAKHGRFGKLPMDNGNQLAETFYLYGIAIYEDREPIRAMVAFSSTQIPKYQTFVGRYMGIKYRTPQGAEVLPPLWAHRWRFTTGMQTRGQLSWFGWNLKLDSENEEPRAALMPMDDPLYKASKDFYLLIREGKAKVDYTQNQPTEEPATRQPGDESEDIPM